MSTQPLEHFSQEIKPIEIAPAQPFEMPVIPDGMTQAPVAPDEDSAPSPFSTPGMPAQEPIWSAPEPRKTEPEVFALTPFEPIEPPASSSPAVGALVVAANQNSRSGNVEVAASSIDRALKIEPRNPSLYYKLALLRLKQNKPQEAEDLAKKSALLAGSDKQLKRHSWLLIAHARELRRDMQGARQARAKANSF
ncbi:MAG: tetratricopeptide repeat protein [Gammaproteobacteria bacterium]